MPDAFPAEPEREQHYALLLEVIDVAEGRGVTFREASRQAFEPWMKGNTVPDSNLMPPPRTFPANNGTPRTATHPSTDAGWAVEADGPMPLAKGKGKSIDPGLYAACCGLGPPPQRIRLDPKKFKSGVVKKILAAIPGLVSFKAADGFTILHRGTTTPDRPAHTPESKPAQPRISPAERAACDVDQTELMRALDAACKNVGDRKAIKELDVKGLDTTEGRATARDIARNTGRYSTSAEFVDGHSGRTIIATRIR